MESKWELAGLHLEAESESGFWLECGGGRIGEEACGGRLTLYGGMATWSYDLELAGIAEGSHAKTRRREEKEEGGFQ
jgi:hypothetical protein